MNPRVKAVQALDNYNLKLTFDNGEVRIFNALIYLDKGIFVELKNEALFKTVIPFMGSVKWKNDQDFCPDTLYEESIPYSTIYHN